ncbi:MAG TPA: EMC3/TMCO1 family protein [Candidatus Methanofastidiosa archaeon]|nr:EMC3/TMCO1 family protein [Candidatus Methanofastidiosa archaeon]
MGFMDVFYDALDGMFSFLPLDDPSQMYFVVIVLAILVGTFMTLVQHFMVDQKELKRMRKEVSDFQGKLMKAQRANDKKAVRKLQLQKPQIDEMNQKMMKQNFKPMYVTMIPAIILYSWLRHTYEPVAVDAVLHLPFSLFDFPLISYLHDGTIAANHLGAIGWYIVFVSFFSNIVRKILDMA